MTVDLVLMVLILILVLYSYTTTQNQFAATASALRQIWSGGCPLSCRHSEYSSLSGLSSRPDSQTAECRIIPPRRAQAAETSRCACENCPCALIENFISSCRPASTMYTQFLTCTYNCIDYFLQMVIGIYEFLVRIILCQASCQTRPAQISMPNVDQRPKENLKINEDVDNRDSFANKLKNQVNKRKKGSLESLREDNVPLVEKDEWIDQNKLSKAKVEKIPKKILEEEVTNKKKEKSERTSKDSDETPHESEYKTDSVRSSLCKTTSDNVLASGAGSSSEPSPNSNCAKCVAKGRTCVKDCPKARKMKNK
ncbi:unnamed protein product [Diatraea saccharalis]|uniref:Uncharacterized protein n=1 Tax=Diatraea saccharalis TaxID=40085 RepID=A0A9N9WEG1_9NEOP|nr:unnamed protein product [Diatraea saccharalis]